MVSDGIHLWNDFLRDVVHGKVDQWSSSSVSAPQHRDYFDYVRLCTLHDTATPKEESLQKLEDKIARATGTEAASGARPYNKPVELRLDTRDYMCSTMYGLARIRRMPTRSELEEDIALNTSRQQQQQQQQKNQRPRLLEVLNVSVRQVGNGFILRCAPNPEFATRFTPQSYWILGGRRVPMHVESFGLPLLAFPLTDEEKEGENGGKGREKRNTLVVASFPSLLHGPVDNLACEVIDIEELKQLA